MIGRVIKNSSLEYTILQENKERIVLKARGKIKYNSLDIKVGDMVEYDQVAIKKVLERKNTFTRPYISNIDYSIVIMSLKMPDISYELLDKFLVNMEIGNTKPIIVITKTDLGSAYELKDVKEKMEYYQKFYPVFYSDKNGLEKKDEFFELIKNKISVVSGQTGAGKSSLLNTLKEGLNLKTQDISLALNRGKHTTRYTELLEFNDAYIADTPGFSSLQITNIKSVNLKDYFPEFVLNLNKCKYNECLHINEPSCIIKEMVSDGLILKSRYENYLKFYNEIKEFEKTYWRMK